MLDAPVSGGEPKAIEGTLSIMVGGKKEIFEQVEEILKVMGASAVLVGDRRAALRIIARATRRWPEVARTIAP